MHVTEYVRSWSLVMKVARNVLNVTKAQLFPMRFFSDHYRVLSETNLRNEVGVTTYNHQDLRIDFMLRRFVSDIIQYLSNGGDHANALMNMIERGVPPEVQRRVLEGRAVVS